MNYFESRLFEFPKIESIFGKKKKSAPKENINPIQIPKLKFRTNNATNIIKILSESIILLRY
jgi:hypothetical protein